MARKLKIRWRRGGPEWDWATLAGKPERRGSSFVVTYRTRRRAIAPPHIHPCDEHITVISGKFRLGLGRKFAAARLKTIPPGGYIAVPKNKPHFTVYDGRVVVQIRGVGPFRTTYLPQR